jgi:hypothetical protein
MGIGDSGEDRARRPARHHPDRQQHPHGRRLPDGDILFDGTLSAKGDRMCGTVTYLGGRTFPMLAQKRPSTYRWQPRAQGAR